MRRLDTFFYGLFMHEEVQKAYRVRATRPRRAFVTDFELHIGQRATLTVEKGSRAYGMLWAVTHDDLSRLYDGPGLEGYRPEAVLAECLDGRCFPALCYNLDEASDPGEPSKSYAEKLRYILSELGFPDDYIGKR